MESPKPDSGSRNIAKPPKPVWPMWPIGLSVVAFIVFYTWVQISFRKPEKAFEPHQAMIDRRNEVAEKNLYDWHSLKPSRIEGKLLFQPAEISVRLTDEPLEKLLPGQLVYYLPRPPILLDQIQSFEAAKTAYAESAYPIALSIPESLGTDPNLVIRAFHKESSLHIFLEWDVESQSDVPTNSDGNAIRFQYGIPTVTFETTPITAFLYMPDQVRSWQIEFTEPELAK